MLRAMSRLIDCQLRIMFQGDFCLYIVNEYFEEGMLSEIYRGDTF